MSSAHAISFIAGSEATFESHRYALLTTDTWTASEDFATSVGGHLVTINDPIENAFVFHNYADFGGIQRTLWIGLNYQGPGLDNTTSWAWSSGDASAYRNWWPADPNGFSSQPYVAIVPPWQDPSSKQWFDAPNGGGGYNVFGVVEFTSVPEPSNFAAMFGVCLLGVAAVRRTYLKS